MGGNFKFQVQDSFLEYFFLRFGDLKKESHFLKKKSPLEQYTVIFPSFFALGDQGKRHEMVFS